MTLIEKSFLVAPSKASSDMYLDESKVDKSLFYQGDILLDFNFPKVSLISGAYTMSQKRENVILLSQTCDLQTGREGNDRVILCPIHTESQLRRLYLNKGISEDSIKGRIGSLMGNKKIGMFYLPKNSHFENSFANFGRMMSLEMKTLDNLQPDVRLEDSARHFLTDKIQAFLCRAIDPTRP